MISVDIETDGPIPFKYSMLSLGAVDTETNKEFYVELRPTSNFYVQEALNANGLNRVELVKNGIDPRDAMADFAAWLPRPCRFMSDNAGFDWQFVNWYFHMFLGENPFGFSPMSLTWFAKGLEKDQRYNKWKKKYRQTKHTHNALDDARGNAEAYRKMKEVYGFK